LLDAGFGEHAGELVGVGPVGVVHRDAGPRVAVVALRTPRLRSAAETVLRAEHRDDVHGTGFAHRVHDVVQRAQHPGRVGHHADPAAPDVLPVAGGEHVRSGPHPARPVRFGGGARGVGGQSDSGRGSRAGSQETAPAQPPSSPRRHHPITTPIRGRTGTWPAPAGASACPASYGSPVATATTGLPVSCSARTRSSWAARSVCQAPLVSTTTTSLRPAAATAWSICSAVGALPVGSAVARAPRV